MNASDLSFFKEEDRQRAISDLRQLSSTSGWNIVVRVLRNWKDQMDSAIFGDNYDGRSYTGDHLLKVQRNLIEGMRTMPQEIEKLLIKPPPAKSLDPDDDHAPFDMET